MEGAGESRKKEYRITAAGRAALEAEFGRLHELVASGEAVLGPGR